jgi:mono/diheme cytochrome c family protein
MLRKLIIVGLIVAIVGLLGIAVVTRPQVIAARALGPHQPNLENGRTMFSAGNCASCHATPNQDDATKLGGGLGLKSPFGTFYAPNISPDEHDGVGGWTEAQFVTALVKGTSPDNAHYYPAFPYPSFQRTSFGDLRDLFAYIKTLPKVTGKAPAHDLSFPFNIRASLGGWKLLFVKAEPFRPDPTKSAAWNRGAYLVNGPAHCAECHSPRNFMGGIQSGQRFAGGPNPEGEGWVPNITQKSLSAWSEADIASFLETGITPESDSVSGPMGRVIKNTAQLSAADRKAIAVYLKSLPPVEGPKKPEKS